jgi:hypothetical protein
MDQQQPETGDAQIQCPVVLDQLAVSQLNELEAQFDEGDRQGFKWCAESLGWTQVEAQEVWTYFEAGKRASSSIEGA